jgi:hypothetical protein
MSNLVAFEVNGFDDLQNMRRELEVVAKHAELEAEHSWRAGFGLGFVIGFFGTLGGIGLFAWFGR